MCVIFSNNLDCPFVSATFTQNDSCIICQQPVLYTVTSRKKIMSSLTSNVKDKHILHILLHLLLQLLIGSLGITALIGLR